MYLYGTLYKNQVLFLRIEQEESHCISKIISIQL